MPPLREHAAPPIMPRNVDSARGRDAKLRQVRGRGAGGAGPTIKHCLARVAPERGRHPSQRAHELVNVHKRVSPRGTGLSLVWRAGGGGFFFSLHSRALLRHAHSRTRSLHTLLHTPHTA